MTQQRSFWPFSILYLVIGGTALALAVAHAEFTSRLWLIVPFTALVMWVDDWPYRVSARITWTNSVIVVMAAIVIAPPTTAAFVGGSVMVGTAFSRMERVELQPSRVAVNAGLFTFVGCVMGAAVELVRDGADGPSIRLLGAVMVGALIDIVLSATMAMPVVWYRYGRSAAIGVRQLLLLARRTGPSVVVAGLLASVVMVAGNGWLWLAIPQILVIAFFPVARARLDVKRARLITTVTRALDGLGLVGTEHARMEGIALHVGRQLGLTESRLQQLRYVVLTYSMTDLFAGEIARPLDLPRDRDFGVGSFSRLLFTGLLLDDIADPQVQAIADAVARYDGLVDPLESDVPLDHAEAIAELNAVDVDPAIVGALAAVAASGESSPGALRRQLEAGYLLGPEGRPRRR